MRIGLTGDSNRDLPSTHPDRKHSVILTIPVRIAGNAHVVESAMTVGFAVRPHEPES